MPRTAASGSPGKASARLYANNYIRGLMAKDAGYGGANTLGEQLSALSSARTHRDAKSRGVIVGSDGKDYQVFAKKDQDYEALRDDTINRANHGQGNARFTDANAFDAAVAKSYGVDEVNDDIAARFVSDANAAHTAAEPPRLWAEKATGNALRNVGRDLISDKPELQAKALEAMNITAEKIQMVHGAAAADGFKAEVAAKLTSGDGAAQKEALTMLGIAESQFGSVIKPEVASTADPVGGKEASGDWWSETQPELKDGPLGGMPRWGLAALGGGAAIGGGALAYHLMAGGQQQSNYGDYAATAQAMNAY